jgi:hypothetical protein
VTRFKQILCALVAIPLAAQNRNIYGTRAGQVLTVFLPDSENGAGRDLLLAQQGDAAARERLVARYGPAFVVPVNATGLPANSPVRAVAAVHFETWAEQLPREHAISVGMGSASVDSSAPGETTIHRFVRDNFQHVYVRYALTVETLPQPGTFRASFAESEARSTSWPPTYEEWHIRPPTRLPAPQLVKEGETINLELYSDGPVQPKIVDYIHFGSQQNVSLRKDVTKDVYADDAEFTIAQPRIRVNGVETAALADSFTGRWFVIQIPDRGRYSVAFKPRPEPGFEKVGEVSGNSLFFAAGPDLLRIDCADRIAMGSGTYNVYVKREANTAGTFAVEGITPPAPPRGSLPSR